MKLVGIEYDCAWNIEHIRGCLKSLEHLFKMHTNEMKCLQGTYRTRKRLNAVIAIEIFHSFIETKILKNSLLQVER